MAQPFQIFLTENYQAQAVSVNSFDELPSALQAIGVQCQRPVLVLVGGASGISESDLVRLRQTFIEVIAPQAESLGAAVVDGGTDAGVMQLMGKARAQIGGTFPLIGVVARGTAIVPNADNTGVREDAAQLEPNHTHFLLVPGNEWGAESPWLARIASILADGSPSVTIVVNGGEITWQDVSQSVRSDRPIIAVAGSGRTADKIAAALQGRITDERARELLAFGKVQAIDLMNGSHPFTEIIKDVLSEKPSPKERKMAKKDPYKEFLKEDFGKIFEVLELEELQKKFLRSRWLDQVLWMEGQAGRARNRYYRLRLTTIIGGVILPALVSLNVSSDKFKTYLVGATFVLSQAVAISAAIEEFFHYGERWRHYRRSVESLKTQGWQFFQLSGPYKEYDDHKEAFNTFSAEVESIIQRDVEVYATQIVQEQKKSDDKKQSQAGSSS